MASAAIIFSIFAFHITMQPLCVPAPIVLAILWMLIALPHLERLSPILAQ